MNAQEEQEVASTLIAMERAALDRWSNGDPSGFLEISAPDVTYFDPYLDSRIDGLEELTRHYEPLRGLIQEDYELIKPKVQTVGNVAILTYNFVTTSRANGDKTRWNCTEVYRNDDGQWKIIQTHLSPAKTR